MNRDPLTPINHRRCMFTVTLKHSCASLLVIGGLTSELNKSILIFYNWDHLHRHYKCPRRMIYNIAIVLDQVTRWRNHPYKHLCIRWSSHVALIPPHSSSPQIIIGWSPNLNPKTNRADSSTTTTCLKDIEDFKLEHYTLQNSIWNRSKFKNFKKLSILLEESKD